MALRRNILCIDKASLFDTLKMLYQYVRLLREIISDTSKFEKLKEGPPLKCKASL